MPYKDPAKAREAKRKSAARRRDRERQAKAGRKRGEDLFTVPAPGGWPDDPGRTAVDWARSTLKVPGGHPLAGEPMALPDYLAAFAGDALTLPESLLCVARKNAKSAAVAALVLAHLAGPLASRAGGWRCGIASVNAQKAGELWRQMNAIADASGLDVDVRRAPVRKISTGAGEVEVLPATEDAGAASSYDLAIVDELGLIHERNREFIASMRSSVSAKGGRFVALSIHGFGPFVPEILERAGAAGLAVHHYRAPDRAALDDREAWHAANPGLAAGIKSLAYMEAECRRVLATPADQRHFEAHDLNRPVASIAGLPLLDAATWARALAAGGAEPVGDYVLGVDLSDGVAMSAIAAWWMQTGRLDAAAAFPAVPGLDERGRADGVGGLYREMADRGELVACGEHAVDVADLLRTARERWGVPAAISADRYKDRLLKQALADIGWSTVPIVWRGQGFKEGAEDVRDFRRAVAIGMVRPVESLLLAAAISEAVVVEDTGASNAKLAKGSEGGRRKRHRDDAAAASILAVAVGARECWRRESAPPALRYALVG